MIISRDYQECMKSCAGEIYQDIRFHKGIWLVSGATGLIGSMLIDCLMEMNDNYSTEFRVIALARNKKRAEEVLGAYTGRKDFKYIFCDINVSIPETGEVDYIVHGASNTHPIKYSEDPIGTIRTNIIGTDHMLDYARTHCGKRFAFLSSVEIYGENKGEAESFREQDMGYLDCNLVRAGYPESKRAGESLCRAYESKYGLDIVIPRLCRVYGPTMGYNDSKAISQFIRNAVKREDIVLKSKGQQYYSYIYVVDAVRAIFCIMDKGKSGEAYNVSSRLSDIKLADLANKLAEISGTKVIFDMPEECERRGYSLATKAILDNTKLKGLGWNEKYDIDKGLEMTVKILQSLKSKQGKML